MEEINSADRFLKVIDIFSSLNKNVFKISCLLQVKIGTWTKSGFQIGAY